MGSRCLQLALSWVRILPCVALLLPPPAIGEETPLSGAEIRQIEIFPAQVKLSNSRSRQQLVVTAYDKEGQPQDVTGTVNWHLADESVAEIKQGVLLPRTAGQTELTAEIAGAQARVQVIVGDLARPTPIEFTSEVIAALTKQGCNGGECHGSPTGKGGFRLSLLGYDPALDELTLTRESYGRRTNPFDPEHSLLMLKPLMKVAHGGGQRLRKTDPAYELLRTWIAEGCRLDAENQPKLTQLEVYPQQRTLDFPAQTQQLAVLAYFSDGSVRDVTPLAVFKSSDEQVAEVNAQGLVRSERRGETAIIVRYQQQIKVASLTFLREVPGYIDPDPKPNNYIDEHLFAKQNLLQIPPSDLCSDGEFIRRLYLDVLGILPDASEVDVFLKDTQPGKRQKLIDDVLARPEYAEYWALKWGDLLRVKSAKISEAGVHKFHRWLTRAMRENKPYDEFVRELLLAQGSTYLNPPANYFRTAQTVNDCAESTSQLFLGIRMQCAKCHNHPYEEWTQENYYGIGSFFSRVQRKETAIPNEREIYLGGSGEVSMPGRSEPARPWLPGVGQVEVNDEQDRRQVFVDWLTDPRNQWFARVGVNRLWGHLFGRGIVEPVDDFRVSNPPASEALLAALADDFIQVGFDQKRMLRTMLQSRTYQLSSRALALNAEDEKYFSHAGARLLSAEQLLDAICHVTDVPEKFSGLPAGMRATALPSPDVANEFLKVFGQPARESVCECERIDSPKLAQALQLINGPIVAAKLRDRNGRLSRELDDQSQRVALAGEPPMENLALWLRADAKETLLDEQGYPVSDGDPAPKWEDRSGAARHVEQPDRTKQPVLIAEGLGNLPTVRFDGRDDCLNNTVAELVPAGSPRTVFIVGQLAAEAPGGAIFAFGRSRTGGSSIFSVQHGLYSGKYYVYSDGVNAAGNATLPLNVAESIRQPFVTCFVSTGVGEKLAVSVNGISQEVSQPGAVGVDRGSTGFSLGTREDIAGFSWGGDISEVLVYDKALSEDSAHAVGSYLATKYGLETEYPEIKHPAAKPDAHARSNREIITSFYLNALARYPTADELTTYEAYLQDSPNRRSGLEDIVWTLLNSKEFLFQH